MSPVIVSILLTLLTALIGGIFMTDKCFPAIGLDCGVTEYTCVLQNYTAIRIGCYPCYNVMVNCGTCVSTDAKFDEIEEIENKFVIGGLQTFYVRKNKCFYYKPSQENTIFGFIIVLFSGIMLLSIIIPVFYKYVKNNKTITNNLPKYTESKN